MKKTTTLKFVARYSYLNKKQNNNNIKRITITYLQNTNYDPMKRMTIEIKSIDQKEKNLKMISFGNRKKNILFIFNQDDH